MEKAFQSRCMAENTPIIEEIVELRRKQADLLGYADHATYIQVENSILNYNRHLVFQCLLAGGTNG